MGNWIAYVVKAKLLQLWLVRPDGRHMHMLVDGGASAAWSPDGRWLYYTPEVVWGHYCVEKISVDGGARITVRDDRNSYVGRSVAASDGLRWRTDDHCATGIVGAGRTAPVRGSLQNIGDVVMFDGLVNG